MVGVIFVSSFSSDFVVVIVIGGVVVVVIIAELALGVVDN